jgi:hypothetical protein
VIQRLGWRQLKPAGFYPLNCAKSNSILNKIKTCHFAGLVLTREQSGGLYLLIFFTYTSTFVLLKFNVLQSASKEGLYRWVSYSVVTLLLSPNQFNQILDNGIRDVWNSFLKEV